MRFSLTVVTAAFAAASEQLVEPHRRYAIIASDLLVDGRRVQVVLRSGHDTLLEALDLFRSVRVERPPVTVRQAVGAAPTIG